MLSGGEITGNTAGAATANAIQTSGLKLIATMKDFMPQSQYSRLKMETQGDADRALLHRFRQLKDHPALLAWYMNDERGQTYVPQLAKRQALVRKLDPEHPTYTVLYQLQILDKYMDTYDIIGTDPYPVGSDDNDYDRCAKWAEVAVNGSFGVRPVWQVPQVFDWGVYWKNKVKKTRMPSARELKNMFWQAVACGANGLIGYSHFDIRRMDWKNPKDKVWADVCEAAEEIRAYAPVILSGDAPPTVTTDNPSVRVRAWRDGKTVHVLAVNTKDVPAKAMVKLEGGATLAADLPGLDKQTWRIEK